MNIFVLDTDVEKCAEYHCDKHVVKMILEHAQMMSTTVRLTNHLEDSHEAYRVTHKNHPCTIWVRESLSNYLWLEALTWHLNEEYKYRYDKEHDHKSYGVIERLPTPNLMDIGMTQFPQAMPDSFKRLSAVDAYREYYIHEKSDIATWKKRKVPSWYKLP